MKILKAKWLITSDNNGTIIKNAAIVFTDKILDIGKIQDLQNKYPNVEIEDLGENSVLMPGLVNSHVHLEFSANTTSLKYGNFLQWLYSVIEQRETLVETATQKLISSKLEEMLRSGTTSIGAISSYSLDLEPCLKSPINTVFFCEVIGSKMEMIDTLFTDFKARLNEALKLKSKSFIPALAIHSPYSVHPFLVRESLNLAKEKDLAVTAHFLESPEEFDWLHKDEGAFLDFFKNFLGQEKAVSKPFEFLNLFKGLKNLSFTHCVEASTEDLNQIKDLGASINHCITSNRLLNNTKLDLEKLEVPFTIGTDGLSSNNSLNMFDELRTCLMMHSSKEVNSFAKILLTSATSKGASALGLNKGILQKDFDADIICFDLPSNLENEEDLATHVILHTKEVKKVYIGGEDV